MNMINFSIIVPAYNIEEYIRACINSLLEQIYPNIEIIIVDDGSTDKTSSILEEYSNEQKIRIIHQENQGLSGARNTGLTYATGRYIIFVDGDDWLEPDCVEKLSKCINENTGFLLFPYSKIYEKKKVAVHLFDKAQLSLHDDIFLRLFGPVEKKYFSPSKLDNISTAWGKVYRADIAKKVFFTDTKEIGTEDCLYNIQYVLQLPEHAAINYCEDTFYQYNKLNVTSLTSTYKKNYVYQRWNFYHKVEKIIESSNINNKDELVQALRNRIVLELFSIFKNICYSDLSTKEKKVEINKILSMPEYEESFLSFNLNRLPFVWRLFFKPIVHKNVLSVLFLMEASRLLRKVI